MNTANLLLCIHALGWIVACIGSLMVLIVLLAWLHTLAQQLLAKAERMMLRKSLMGFAAYCKVLASGVEPGYQPLRWMLRRVSDNQLAFLKLEIEEREKELAKENSKHA